MYSTENQFQLVSRPHEYKLDYMYGTQSCIITIIRRMHIIKYVTVLVPSVVSSFIMG